MKCWLLSHLSLHSCDNQWIAPNGSALQPGQLNKISFKRNNWAIFLLLRASISSRGSHTHSTTLLSAGYSATPPFLAQEHFSCSNCLLLIFSWFTPNSICSADIFLMYCFTIAQCGSIAVIIWSCVILINIALELIRCNCSLHVCLLDVFRWDISMKVIINLSNTFFSVLSDNAYNRDMRRVRIQMSPFILEQVAVNQKVGHCSFSRLFWLSSQMRKALWHYMQISQQLLCCSQQIRSSSSFKQGVCNVQTCTCPQLSVYLQNNR